MASNDGNVTDSIVRNITKLYRNRKLRLDVDSVDAPIANYYVYVLMQEGKTMDYGSWYLRMPGGGIISNGNFELSLVILNKRMFKNTPMTKLNFKMALESTGLCGDNVTIDLRYVRIKSLMKTVEMYRQIIYEKA